MTHSHRACLIPTCDKNIKKQSYHELPSNMIRRQKWLKNIFSVFEHVRMYDCSSICNLHFEKDCYKSTASGRRMLKKDAVPTIFKRQIKIPVARDPLSLEENNLNQTDCLEVVKLPKESNIEPRPILESLLARELPCSSVQSKPEVELEAEPEVEPEVELEEPAQSSPPPLENEFNFAMLVDTLQKFALPQKWCWIKKTDSVILVLLNPESLEKKCVVLICESLHVKILLSNELVVDRNISSKEQLFSLMDRLENSVICEGIGIGDERYSKICFGFVHKQKGRQNLRCGECLLIRKKLLAEQLKKNSNEQLVAENEVNGDS